MRRDEATAPWGIKVSIVEVKDVEIPANMQRAMARQAEAERERRAKIINAEGVFPGRRATQGRVARDRGAPGCAAAALPADVLELGASQSATIVFPAPIDLITPFLDRKKS